MTTESDRELPDYWNPPNYRHGHAPAGGYSTTYEVWKNMIQRCTNPKHPRYADYGGRGIKVTPDWLTFIGFFNDMGERPCGDTLERVDNSLGYSKENCKWASPSEQNYNQRLRRDNKTGLKGINWAKHRVYAVVRVNNRLRYLYKGTDFFEACCARKSWEANRGGR